MPAPYRVLLYYCYTPIDDPAAFRAAHHRYCLAHNLRGRIIVAPEGINGTLSGLAADCTRYMEDLHADPRFAKTAFKVQSHPTHVFRKMHVRVKPEIVHAGLPDLDPNLHGGTYVSPQAFAKMKDEPDVVVVDARSRYEHQLGKFAGSVTLDIDHFRAFPEHVTQLKPYQHKRVVTVCTGGVKCEKFSAYLKQAGFEQVYQLHGGILRYGLETDGQGFEGTCYVFDQRLTTPINRHRPTVISHCHGCSAPCERMVNCANPTCNAHVALCSSCSQQQQGACSTACRTHPQKRPYNGTGYYTTQLNGYNPYKGLAPERAH